MEKAIEAAKAAGKWGGDQGIEQTTDDRSEVYAVREALWKAAGMEAQGAQGRKTFLRNHAECAATATRRDARPAAHRPAAVGELRKK